MRNSFAKNTILASVAFLAGILSTSALTLAGGEARAASSTPYGVLSQFARVLTLVEQQYVEPVDRARLMRGAIKGMVAELDPHSAYLPAEDYAVFQDDTEGRFGGVGVEVDFRNDQVTVIAPIEGSPAFAAGIRSGDRIVAINGTPIKGKSADELIREMRGLPGTKVRLDIRREGRKNLLRFTLTRRIIAVASVTSKLLKDGVYYLRIKQFQSGTHRELLKKIASLRRQATPRGVLLDLRNNPGGLVAESTAVADEFLGSGVVYTARHRGKVVDEVRSRSGGSLRRGPLVVLVNEFSASASELVAGALQDHRRATVVGMPTFGKGSVQSIIDLPRGDGLRLTTMRYYTPLGRAIQAQGIAPDVRVASTSSPNANFGFLREADLENHLPAEGKSSKKKRSPSELPNGYSETDIHLGVAQDVPVNPTGTKDNALSVAYQIVCRRASQEATLTP